MVNKKMNKIFVSRDKIISDSSNVSIEDKYDSKFYGTYKLS